MSGDPYRRQIVVLMAYFAILAVCGVVAVTVIALRLAGLGS